MVFNLFSKSERPDPKPLFGHKLNNNVYAGTKDLITRHFEAIYAELREDLKNSPRADQILALSPQDYHSQPGPPQQDPQGTQPLVHIHQYPCAVPEHSEHHVTQYPVLQHPTPQRPPILQYSTPQHPVPQHPAPQQLYPAPYGMGMPQQFQNAYRQDGFDGLDEQNRVKQEGHLGHTRGPSQGSENANLKPLPPSGDHPNTVQEAPPASYGVKMPQPFQGVHHQGDFDGQNRGGHERHSGHNGGSSQVMQIISDTERLPPSGDHLDVVQGPPSKERREGDQSAALRIAITEAFKCNTADVSPSMPLRPRIEASSHLVNDLPGNSYPQRKDFRSGNQGGEPRKRSFEPRIYSENIRCSTPDISPTHENPPSEALREVTNKILHWIEACQKRLLCLPGVTIENFRRALDAIPPEIHLGERYISELETLARRLERLYWQMMKHDDFQYIRSTCDGAQTRVEGWSRNLRLARHLSSIERPGVYYDRRS